ncbi:MAG: type VI secretion system tube protein Hcp [Gammaproteobacteria bacterium]|nr:type VI secretion system tube protein Hcp [Gammaproteobacteria bacterium]MCF6324469.1 type VI secretion system tube protein Hcp [Gammaproteobacteria bacterium]
MAIYIEYEGIKGNVTATGYKNHIQVTSLAFGVLRGISMEPGNMSNREATCPSLSQITLKKIMDNSVASFFKKSVTEVAGKKVTIKFVHTGSDSLIEFMSYTLDNCLISGYSVTINDQGEPQETLSLSFSKILLSYIGRDSANKSNSPTRVGYDLSTAKVV